MYFKKKQATWNSREHWNQPVVFHGSLEPSDILMLKFTNVLLTRGIETIRSNSGEKFFWSANSSLFQCYLFDQKDGVPDIRAQQSLPEKIIFRAEMVTLTSIWIKAHIFLVIDLCSYGNKKGYI